MRPCGAGALWPKSRATMPMKKPEIEEFFRRLSAALPAPETELKYINTYTLLVAVVLMVVVSLSCTRSPPPRRSWNDPDDDDVVVVATAVSSLLLSSFFFVRETTIPFAFLFERTGRINARRIE